MVAPSKAERIVAVREGGWTDRMHASLKQRRYSVAEHSWNVVNLILLLFPHDVTVHLLKAAQWHDVPERWTGDSPAPAKRDRSNGELSRVLHALEGRIKKILGLNVDLTMRERKILAICDMFEFVIWCEEEAGLGNTHIEGHWRDARSRLKRMDLYGEIAATVHQIEAAKGTEFTGWWTTLMERKDVKK